MVSGVHCVYYRLVFPRFSGHTEEFQLIKNKVEVCHGEGEEHRYFDKEFKYEAIRLMNEGKRSVKDIAGDLGIHPNLLHQWRRKYRADMEQAFPGKGHMKPPEEETSPVTAGE